MENLIIYPSWESKPPVAQLSVLKTNSSAISIIVFLWCKITIRLFFVEIKQASFRFNIMTTMTIFQIYLFFFKMVMTWYLSNI